LNSLLSDEITLTHSEGIFKYCDREGEKYWNLKVYFLYCSHVQVRFVNEDIGIIRKKDSNVMAFHRVLAGRIVTFGILWHPGNQI